MAVKGFLVFFHKPLSAWLKLFQFVVILSVSVFTYCILKSKIQFVYEYIYHSDGGTDAEILHETVFIAHGIVRSGSC